MGLETVGRNELSTSRTYLDSHPNIVVVERNVQIISDTSRIAEVSLFTPDYDSMDHSPVEDATIRHDNDCTGGICVIIVSDAISAPAMDHNAILPFAMREVVSM